MPKRSGKRKGKRRQGVRTCAACGAIAKGRTPGGIPTCRDCARVSRARFVDGAIELARIEGVPDGT